MFIAKDNCPTCGVRGDVWKEQPDIFKCPGCSSMFSEFGLVAQGETNEVQLS